jgi:hypothetical protein
VAYEVWGDPVSTGERRASVRPDKAMADALRGEEIGVMKVRHTAMTAAQNPNRHADDHHPRWRLLVNERLVRPADNC